MEAEGRGGVVPISSRQKQESQTRKQRPGAAALCGELMRWRRGGKAGGKRERERRTSLHDGSVNDGFDVVLSVSRVDDPLSFGVLLDVVLCEELKTHI